MTQNKLREERMAEIISAAVLEFVEKGYEGASMNSIATRAGLSKGGLYHHFSTKDDILLAANHEFMKPVYGLMDRAISEEDPAKGLKSYIRNYLAHWKQHKNEMVFTFLSFAKLLQDETRWGLYDQYANEMVFFYESLFKKGIETGVFRPHNAESRAVTLFTALDGATGYLIMCESLRFEDIVRYFIDIYVDELNTKTKAETGYES